MMFKNVILIQILIIQVFVSSCAYINAQRDDVDSLITKWLTEQEFDKAQQTLLQVKTTHPQYLKLMLRKKEINEKSNLFVATTIKQAHFFIKESKWEDAYTVYKFALDRVSENKGLNTSFKNYLEKRQLYISNLKQKILIHNAVRLIKDLPVQRKIALAIKETPTEQKQFENLQKQARTTIELLVKCSSDSLSLKKIDTAQTCVKLAIKLGPTEESSKQIKLQQTKISKLTAGKAKRIKRAESNIQSKLLKQYNAAFEKNDLYTANKKLTLLLAENKDNYEFKKIKTVLDEAINKKIKTGIVTGRILYSKGNIKLALDKWLSLMKLDPDNVELKSHISRAERVLRKLRTLTNKDDTNNNSRNISGNGS